MTTTTLKWTALRHRMLRSMADDNIVLWCTSVKRGIWKPVDARLEGERLNLSAAEARAVNVFGPTGSWWAQTPDWDGDMDKLRRVELRAAGRDLLAEWDREHPESAGTETKED
jgi:hypothetical protein